MIFLSGSVKKRNRGGVSYLISFLSIYPPPLFLWIRVGVMNPLCLICFTRYDVPCGLGLSSLRILIFNLSDFKIQLIVKKKKNSVNQIVTCHQLED